MRLVPYTIKRNKSPLQHSEGIARNFCGALRCRKGLFHHALLLPINEDLPYADKNQCSREQRDWISPFVRFCIGLLLLGLGGSLELVRLNYYGRRRVLSILLCFMAIILVFAGCLSLPSSWWNRLLWLR